MDHFDSDRPCPKCGGTNASFTYDKVSNVIVRVCQDCTYTWDEAPLDA